MRMAQESMFERIDTGRGIIYNDRERDEAGRYA